MAKRKTARAAGRRKKARRAGAGRSRPRAAAARGKRGGARKAAARPRKASARRARNASKAKARVRRTGRVAQRPARPALAGRSAKRRTAPAGRARKAARKPARAKRVAPRKAPALNRERRTIGDEGLLPSPPSSLDLDRSASAARTGRRELHEKFTQHTETSPAMTGGDIDANWESAYSVGDEAPGGDNPTPDQDIVDDIGRAVGVEYEDNEELKGDKKISDRDKRRWELDPASAEDYDER